ncbi:MAG: 5-bromo-4-chloroindolyl phosphate hydrolysis family protein [Paracoccaceae bacterium]
MANRFGGKFSPDASGPLRDKAPQKGRTRANLLFFAGLPLLFTAFGDGPFELGRNLIAFLAIALAAWLTREGLTAEDAYNSRTIARRPALPRKMLGSVMIGLGVGLACFSGGLVSAGLYGVIAAGLHLFSFGFDPMQDKGVAGADDFQSDRVVRAVDEAEKHLAAMHETIKTTGDRVMLARVEKFQTTARAMFRVVENDPRALTAARRYLGVYLLGAKDASEKFAKLYVKTRDEQAQRDYTALLDDLEANFAAKTDTALLGSRTDLDIEINVLRDRLQREGITPN